MYIARKFSPNRAVVPLRLGYKNQSVNAVKGKRKAVPLQALTGPEGSRKLRFPDFVTTAQDGGRLSALCTGRLYPRKDSWYSFLLQAESTPGPQCDRKDFMSMKNPMTPATFRFVAQHLNHCATAVPQLMLYREIIAVCSQIHIKHKYTVWEAGRVVGC